MKQFLRFTLGLLFLVSCTAKSNKNADHEVIARVNDAYLYLNDIKDIVSQGTSSKDSLDHLIKYIDNWVRESLVIQKAEDNLTKEQKDVEKQLQNYRNSLITYAYEKELIKQKLNTKIENK